MFRRELIGRPNAAGGSGNGMQVMKSGGERVDKGKKLLLAGHDGLSGFTSVAFKMHEGIR
jgi:anaphase-promoting complex subunit 10